MSNDYVSIKSNKYIFEIKNQNHALLSVQRFIKKTGGKLLHFQHFYGALTLRNGLGLREFSEFLSGIVSISYSHML